MWANRQVQYTNVLTYQILWLFSEMASLLYYRSEASIQKYYRSVILDPTHTNHFPCPFPLPIHHVPTYSITCEHARLRKKCIIVTC